MNLVRSTDTPYPYYQMSNIFPHSLPGRRSWIHIPPRSPSLSFFFPFLSSYLPCWRVRDQKGGSLLLELCIAQRGSPGGQVIFGYLAGAIFDGHLSHSIFSSTCFMALCRGLKKSFRKSFGLHNRDSGLVMTQEHSRRPIVIIDE